MWLILAQAVGVEGSGWAASGLLGLVLSWLLLKHLPDKDKLILSVMESRDKSNVEQRQEFSSTIKRLGDSVQSVVDRLTAHCKEEVEALADRLGTSLDKVEDALRTALALREKRGGNGT